MRDGGEWAGRVTGGSAFSLPSVADPQGRQTRSSRCVALIQVHHSHPAPFVRLVSSPFIKEKPKTRKARVGLPRTHRRVGLRRLEPATPHPWSSLQCFLVKLPVLPSVNPLQPARNCGLKGSRQPAEASGNTQTTSGPSDTPHTPCVQMRDQALRYRSIHTQLMEMVLTLQQTVEDHIMQLTTRPQQRDLALEEQWHGQAIREQEALLGRLLFQIVSFLPAGAPGDQSVQPPCTSTDSRGDVGGGQPVQANRQTGQMFYQESDFENTVISYDLSNRGIDISALYHLSFRDYDTYQGNKYHKDKNTLGYINLGTSENKLCTDLLAERLSQSDMTYVDEDLLQYTDWRGQPFLRKEVARFLTFYCKTPKPLDPENVVILNGCSAVFSALAMVLCDPGEAFLVPTPAYGGFAFSTHLYAKVKLVPVHLESQVTEANGYPFQLTVDKLEHTLLRAKIEGKKVRGLVLINPQNPLGDVYSQDSMMEYLEFAKKYNLHVIVDEMYMLSVFDEAITFHSVLSMKSLPDPNKTHVIWGASKDFCISGFRFGALYTHNREVASAMSCFGYLHSISGIAQYKLRQLLQDREWIDNIYLPSYHFRLQEAHRYVTRKLKASKVPFLNRGSGLYVWINLKQYLDPCTFEEELLLHRRFLDHKLILSPGKTFMCKEPGWFRLVFAARPHLLRNAMRRFQQVLVEQAQERTVKQLEDAMKEEVSTPQPEAPASPALRKS